MRKLATVVVVGLLSTLFLTLLALPSLYYLMNRRREAPHDEGGVLDPDELQENTERAGMAERTENPYDS